VYIYFWRVIEMQGSAAPEDGGKMSSPSGWSAMPANDFTAWLGKLGAERDVSLESDDPVSRVSSNVAYAVLSLSAANGRSAGGASNYYAEAVERSAIASAPPSFADLKAEVGKAASIAELRRLRRSFATVTHPDRKAADDPAATHRMAAANELIDAAILAIRRKQQR
jgi:hypothetical protein